MSGVPGCWCGVLLTLCVLHRLFTCVQKHQKETRLLTAASRLLGADDRQLQGMLQTSLEANLKRIQSSFVELLRHSTLEVHHEFQAQRKSYLRSKDSL